VPEGLLSAEFPPMMVQTLVENAIKHGLEPKPEGGHLRVSAHIEHGKLVVEVADTGLGFGRAATSGTGVRDLGREMAGITPYLEILKVRMEDRLATQIDVPEGLRSAEFPPMMIQSLVENAVKHGLEPKPEGGTLTVKAEIVHGKLAVTVADTGLGFGKAATAGTGIGLNNIRERLQLLYGNRATLSVAENLPYGTKVTITVPYVARARDDATMTA
jgi:LytS/YehU family sensor histidine kinase